MIFNLRFEIIYNNQLNLLFKIIHFNYNHNIQSTKFQMISMLNKIIKSISSKTIFLIKILKIDKVKLRINHNFLTIKRIIVHILRNLKKNKYNNKLTLLF